MEGVLKAILNEGKMSFEIKMQTSLQFLGVQEEIRLMEEEEVVEERATNIKKGRNLHPMRQSSHANKNTLNQVQLTTHIYI